jgi:hypothetical protein
MQLQNLYQNFNTASDEEQLAMLIAYRTRRAVDLETELPKKKSSTASSKIPLTEEEKAIMKVLGLKQKDIIALRELNVEESTNDTLLFEDELYSEGGDDA